MRFHYNKFTSKFTRGGRFELPRSKTNGLAVHRRARLGHPRLCIKEIMQTDKNVMFQKTNIKNMEYILILI